MPTIQEDLAQLEESYSASLAGIQNEEDLRRNRATTFGKLGPFTKILRRMDEVPSSSKREVGEQVNATFRRMSTSFSTRMSELIDQSGTMPVGT